MICILDKDTFSFANTAVTIGKFDALHIGHKALLEKMAEYKKAGLKTVVLRLDIPSSGQPVRTEAERIGILGRYGTDVYIRLAFTERLARMSAEDFVKDYLVKKLGVKKLIVGEDFRFGHERRGNTEMLLNEGQKYGFETIKVEKIRINGETVSSSNIRMLLKNGETEKAREMLGDDRDGK